jgi:hypothetical protein
MNELSLSTSNLCELRGLLFNFFFVGFLLNNSVFAGPEGRLERAQNIRRSVKALRLRPARESETNRLRGRGRENPRKKTRMCTIRVQSSQRL